ncbi:MAG TPA: LytTR family DNA-binding domain-containing protein [Steroidobacteraceae bacterium]|nr:LytTR family DNA-binding domain-containing protein [Steroidobacteraceae bacterium]
MKAPTALIAEDEPLLRAELREALAALWPELQICGEAADGNAALSMLEATDPQILFLDIRMPGTTGLEVARRASGRCLVVFVTAYDEHAIAAFEQGAADYVMKPFTTERLALTVARLRERLTHAPPVINEVIESLLTRLLPPHEYLRWVRASVGTEIRLAAVEEVLYFKSDSKYTLAITREAELPIRKPLRELLAELDPGQFWQIHRSTIVNLSAIASVRHGFDGRLYVRLRHRDESLKVSQPFAARFRQM